MPTSSSAPFARCRPSPTRSSRSRGSPQRSSALSAAARDATKARGVLTAVVIFLVFASIVVVLWVGAQDVLAGDITPGRLGQFVLYAVFAAGGLSELSQVWGEIAQASGAAERLFEILDVEPQIKVPARPVALPTPARGEIEFHDVSFEYPGRPNATRAQSCFVCALRPGKSSLWLVRRAPARARVFQLIQRFYDPVAGTVSFDGVRVTDVDPAALRSRIALVPQDAVVFGTSVAENIRFGRPAATDAEIEKAAEAAHASDFIRRLPDGYETRSASAALRYPADSVSASPSRAPSCVKLRSCCSTRRPHHSMPKAKPSCSRHSGD